MNKDEYLKALEIQLSTLTEDQIADIIKYYSNYFDDANDDEKLIDELGTPEELSQNILKKINNDIEIKDSSEVVSEECIDENALYFSYEPSSVRNLTINLGAAHVVMVSGKKISVETRGVDKDCLFCELKSNGSLIISNSKRVNLNFWGHDRKSRVIPRILITVPENVSFNRLNINFGAGNFIAKNTCIVCGKGCIEVGAGNLNAGVIKGGLMTLRCGMGNLEMTGTITGNSNIDCGLGSVNLKLSGNKDDYSYESRVVLGDFKMNDDRKSGFGRSASGEKKENNLSVRSILGAVAISIS